MLSFVALCSDIHAARTVKGAATFEDFRPIGDRRIWSFVSRDSLLGQLVSGVEERTEIDGAASYRLEGGVRIDFRRMGGQAAMAVHSNYHVSQAGAFLGYQLTFQIDSARTEELRLARKGKSLEGYFTRAGERLAHTIDWPRDYFALDANFVDQLEIYLAMRDLSETAQISDTLFVPQVLGFTPLSAQVGEVEWRELWQGRFDSVVGVHFTEPQRMTAFVSLDHRLVRVDFLDQQYRVFQDVVRQANKSDGAQTPAPVQRPKLGAVAYVALALQYLAYIIVAALVLAVLAYKGYRWSDSYVGLLFGGFVFGLALVTQIPAQKYVVANFLIPELRQGQSLYVLGLLPAMLGGVIQECLKLLGIYAVQFHRQTSPARIILVGAFVAAAFGIAEACYIAEPTQLLSWQLFERSMRITYHASSGALLAIALESEQHKRFVIIAGLMLMNSLMFYLPVFAQQAAFSPGALHFGLAAVAMITLSTAVFMIKGFKPRPKTADPGPTAEEVKS